MPNEENTQQMSGANGHQRGQLFAAVQDLRSRLDGVEQIILARLNDTRPFEQQLIAQLKEINDKLDGLSLEQTGLRVDFNNFREETNANFRLMRQKQELLNNDNLGIRAEHNLLEKRVARLEEQAV